MSSLGTELPNETNRVRALQERYKLLRATGVNVEPAIALMEQAIRRAISAADVLEMLVAYEDLKGFEE